ncbi:endonuclease/exonuclease/phosphatase family protein [Ramlibacter sp. AN1015]|uniref:endonuclease/exonuclease/phosphatase family protein n=1 Tax=Ramlibacter sp. AN1015 TaxID=3133428 RepID=UPI0030C3161A
MALSDLRRTSGFVILLLLAATCVASLLPWVETDTWWVRYMDFIRVQLFIAIVALLALWLLVARPRRTPRPIWLGVLVVSALALGYHSYRLHPYLPFAEPSAVVLDTCTEDSRLRLFVANVKRDNELAEPFLELVARYRPDVLVVLETDAWWDRRLSTLRGRFSDVVQSIPDDHAYYGMHVFSRFELVEPEFRFLFGEPTPTLSSGVRLPSGKRVQLFAMHPRPPQAWSQPTTSRDAHLMQIALEAREAHVPTILAGDFNAVPWERSVRRAMRIGGLLDPRVGRGFIPTYEAGSIIKSWPLDQVLFQKDLGLLEFERLPNFGSDHYPIFAQLCLAQAPGLQAAPGLQPGDLEEAAATVEAAQKL